MTAVDIVQLSDRQKFHPERRDALIQDAFHHGLLLLGCGESAIRFCPPLCITAEQVETALRILSSTLAGQRPEKVAV